MPERFFTRPAASFDLLSELPKGDAFGDLTQLARFRATRTQEAHSLLTENPSLWLPSVQESLGLKFKHSRDSLITTTAQGLGKSYVSLNQNRDRLRLFFPVGLAISPESLSQLSKVGDIVASADAVEPEKATLPANNLLLIDDERWPVRSQNGGPTCIAYATAACLELLRDRVAADRSDAPERISARYLYRNMREAALKKGLSSKLWLSGGTKFANAQEAIADSGFVRAADYPDHFLSSDYSNDSEKFNAVDQKVTAMIKEKQISPAAAPVWYEDYSTGARAPGLALRVYERLANGAAVGVAIPGFSDPLLPDRTTWHSPDFLDSGVLPAPLPTQTLNQLGHAVCVFGFQRNEDLPPTMARDDFGGYFIFKNSWGTRYFALRSPLGLMPGFGLLPASVVEYFGWEFISF
jgi:hypothetical protein